MENKILSFKTPAYTGVDVFDVPDPDGFPVYEDPSTGTRYRCLAFYSDSKGDRNWYVFGILREEDKDIIFFGFVQSLEVQGLCEFNRSEVLNIATSVMEFDPVGLQGLYPPFYWPCNHVLHKAHNTPGSRDWLKVDGPVTRPENWREYLN
ncbi:MAG TPA: hypothetical protein PK846_19380 [Spirochaetota bacterium]|nr:hypothetical protein [Spirochaetota bacterium]